MAYDEIQVAAAECNKILEVMVRDATTGMGKTGLSYSSVAYGYWREGAALGASGTCVAMTKGTYVDHGWVEVDATNLPGVYQFGVPNVALAPGANAVTVSLQAVGILDKAIRILLMASDGRTALAVASTALDNTVWTNTKASYLDSTVSGVAASVADLALETTAQSILATTDQIVITDGKVEAAAAITLEGDALDTLADSIAAKLAYTDGDAQRTIHLQNRNTGLPIPDVEVWLTSDVEGTHPASPHRYTDDAGDAKFMVTLGETYYIWCRSSAVDFTNPTSWEAT